jgi:hypothetical protein
VELAALAVVAVIGELVKRFAQLWGSNNNRPKITPIHKQYAYFTAHIDFTGIPVHVRQDYGTGNQKRLTSEYRVVFYNYAADSAGGQFEHENPGIVTYSQTTLFLAGGWSSWYMRSYITGTGPQIAEQYLDFPRGVEKSFAPMTYKYYDSANQVLPSATWNGDPLIGNTYDTVPVVPQTSPSPLDRLPPVPAAAAIAQAAPLQQAQTPTAEGVPVVPVVTPSPALVTTAQTTRTNFYMPDRLPAPLAPPATKTRTTTGAGTVVAPAALPIPQTSTDQRVYGSQVITSIGVRPDVVAIAEEVGRMEQKMGRLLGNMDQTPDWLDGAIGPLLNALKDALLDALVVDVPATTYDFEAPCDVDANGDPVVLEQAIAAADYQPAIVARLDAIAAAMGILKGWKQPMCRTSPPRSNVTVTAYEISPEA